MNNPLLQTVNKAPVLGYYKLRGWAGPIRLMLAYLGVDHVEKMYPVPTLETGMGIWGMEKYSLGLDFPNIPYWMDDVIKLTETKAILKHLARVHNPKLLGSDIEQEGNANMVEEVLWDMWLALAKICLEHTDQTKADFISGEANEKLALLNNYLKNKTFAVGNDITYVDFVLFEVLHHYHKLSSGTLLQPFQNLTQYLIRFRKIPAIDSCLKSSNFVSEPCFSYKFKSKL